MVRPKEKERHMPFSKVTALFNPKTGRYEDVKPAKKPQKTSSSMKAPRRRNELPTIFEKQKTPGYSAGQKRRRPSNDGGDFPDPEPANKKPSFLARGDERTPNVYNPYHGTYERLTFNSEGVYDHAASSGRRNMPQDRQPGLGMYGCVSGPAVRKAHKRNAGLPDDDPTVMFKGLPLVVAMRKKEELQKKFPGLSSAQLVQKKRELDLDAARAKKAVSASK